MPITTTPAAATPVHALLDTTLEHLRVLARHRAEALERLAGIARTGGRDLADMTTAAGARVVAAMRRACMDLLRLRPPSARELSALADVADDLHARFANASGAAPASPGDGSSRPAGAAASAPASTGRAVSPRTADATRTFKRRRPKPGRGRKRNGR